METEPEANPVADDTVTPEMAAELLQQEANTTEEPAQETEGVPKEEGAEQDELDKLIGAEAEQGESELIEVEYDGKQYKLPSELKDALLRQQDYTKKTMDLAEQRKAAESERAKLESFRNLSNERLTAVQNALSLKAEIQRIENIPVDGLSQDEINGYRIDLQDLQRQVAQWENYGREVARREEAERSQQFAKARETALSEASRRVPGFTESRRAELEAFAVTMGANQDEVGNIADPAVYEILHWADVGKKFAERQRKAKTIKDASAVKPAPELGANAKAGKNPEAMSPAEMAKFLGY